MLRALEDGPIRQPRDIKKHKIMLLGEKFLSEVVLLLIQRLEL